ncbi:MAG: DegT/DnrJ/EryC1/StrS family aminotransferase [Hydrogenophaga sp.]|uniref:DegT/DnrJ/EryC1/StrS family aminotransferase n=1 Tax=Hydrogenophaga sp. TaxID=1904254 RepID=UPI0027164F4A|nr:DegT/DnrJ/EryC1/StrS family aminotransferase [Hydrogenophaga sp.]MDO9147068.1 DegT/DnrJ/EryC1/StrS family aminotransferase [Hydrogenophaga sp.]MDO9605984.1 DegT/DnrJ/EryC1/StrS family aminotransferase [Hydrogenophaga sp.]MDP2163210.1 DegT/DnrJ/EryC1/StrS family aminotransferase [Hydrogenophaga sp.]MDP3476307.1 DegT/DnrJ/EryC1/StrS family aminotransferase [Hydrogenophaga sp.]
MAPTCNIDPALIEAAITPRTKVILPGLPLPAGVRRHRAADGLLSSGDGPSHGPSQK